MMAIEVFSYILFFSLIFSALLCFASDANKACEIFNTTDVSYTAWSQYKHRNVAIGYYMGKPTTVGDYDGYPNNKKVETYSSTGWTGLRDHPE